MALYEFDGIRIEVPANRRYCVAENATVLGRVLIEEDASIWFNAVLRGDTEPISIGARANVQDGCVLHTDIGFPLLIGAEVTIGHGAILHGCSIGEGSREFLQVWMDRYVAWVRQFAEQVETV